MRPTIRMMQAAPTERASCMTPRARELGMKGIILTWHCKVCPAAGFGEVERCPNCDGLVVETEQKT